jgi:hypothetical protein
VSRIRVPRHQKKDKDNPIDENRVSSSSSSTKQVYHSDDTNLCIDKDKNKCSIVEL